MGWMQRLYETYENNIGMVGNVVEGSQPLPPVAHILANAQIEITITEEGDFRDAHIVEKDQKVTFIPVTEESSGRSSGVAPQPLCDMLPYVAGDFSLYLIGGSKEAKTSQSKFQAYAKQLEMWVNSEYTHPKIKAILIYCKNQNICANLLQAGILKCDEDGIFLKERVVGQPYEKCLVRWRVISQNDPFAVTATWEDVSLFEAYISYINSQSNEENQQICYVTGKKETVAVNHPKGIIAASYGAKLLSANDTSGFTYRGRFLNPTEAFTVSYDATQKAHNTLRWLLANQGL